MRAITGSNDGTARVWELTDPEWARRVQVCRVLIAHFGAYRQARRVGAAPAPGPSWQLTVVQRLPRVALAELMAQLKPGGATE